MSAAPETSYGMRAFSLVSSRVSGRCLSFYGGLCTPDGTRMPTETGVPYCRSSALSKPPARPVARTPLLMSHGSNPDRFLQLDVVDRVGEPAKPEFPRPLFVDGSVDSGPLADASEGILKVFAEFAAEPCPLSLVVSDGLPNLRFRLRVDRQRLHGYRSRNSARNASASRPRAVPDRISATRLEASESQAASTSSSSGSREERRKCANSARSLGGNCTSFAFQTSSPELIDSNPGDQG